MTVYCRVCLKPGQFQLSNSSIICIAILSSSTSVPFPASISAGGDPDDDEGDDPSSITNCFFFLLPNSTLITQFEVGRGPARSCHTPM
uniref:Uncharacterized protein n=1 Tax=Rhizophora mucronata TaxID=61149 RepID=A0A2P2Q7U8_RHIMU